MKTVWARISIAGDITLYSTHDKAIWRGSKADPGYYEIKTIINRDGETVTELWRGGEFVASIMEMEVR